MFINIATVKKSQHCKVFSVYWFVSMLLDDLVFVDACIGSLLLVITCYDRCYLETLLKKKNIYLAFLNNYHFVSFWSEICELPFSLLPSHHDG